MLRLFIVSPSLALATADMVMGLSKVGGLLDCINKPTNSVSPVRASPLRNDIYVAASVLASFCRERSKANVAEFNAHAHTDSKGLALGYLMDAGDDAVWVEGIPP